MHRNAAGAIHGLSEQFCPLGKQGGDITCLPHAWQVQIHRVEVVAADRHGQGISGSRLCSIILCSSRMERAYGQQKTNCESNETTRIPTQPWTTAQV